MFSFRSPFSKGLGIFLLLIILPVFAVPHPSVKEIAGIYKPSPSYQSKEQILVERPIVYDNGILFTYLGKPEEKVYLSGSFINWKEKIKMKGDSQGLFQVFLSEPLQAGTYTYRFLVNGLWINDTQQPYYTIDSHGEQVSYFKLDKNILFTILESPQKLNDNYYRFYLKDNRYQEVYFIGNFNYWDPTSHPMKLENGYWYFDKQVDSPDILYSFWVDGQKVKDPLNSNEVENEFGLVANYWKY